ncbi:uncharacterized protein LOC133791824 [Humulus lupulus]|uniref:uncharacterized protein LOC133791824 n=1 Tax=Humulus lupulus TaxID=3486 RepID=UPI002B40C4C4|nr:uncharacterized protein LOC133791824 [Humulus lupulus]
MEEAKDFGKMKVEELMGSLRTFELNQQIMKKGKPNPSIEKNKGIAFKVSEKDISDDEKDDEMALLTRIFQKFMKKVGNKRIFQKLQKNKKGFNVTWSDDDSESSEEDNEKVALTSVLSSAFQERGNFLCLNNTLTDVDNKEIDSNSDESELNEESLAESYKVMYELDKLKRNVKMLNPGSNIFEEVRNSGQLSHAGLGFVETQSKMNTKFVKSENMSSGYFDSTLQGSIFTAECLVSIEIKQSCKPENSHGKKKRLIPSCHFCGVKGHIRPRCLTLQNIGCARHMTGDKDFLVNIRPMKCGEVTFGNGLAGNVIGMGTLNLEGLARLKNVMLVEGLRVNLLSVSQICDQGYTVNFDSNHC